MEEKDHLENKFKSSFIDFDIEPPDRVWENLSRELHPEPNSETIWSRIAAFSIFRERRLGFYLALGAAAIIIFLTIVYIGSTDYHAIRGHAYTGEVRLCRGTAVLFKVADQVMPWDSVSRYRSAMIDDNGHYQFSHVEAGKYLLRISPDGNSEAAVKFLPSWFDQHDNSDSCHLIIVNKEDVNADVHLISNSER